MTHTSVRGLVFALAAACAAGASFLAAAQAPATLPAAEVAGEPASAVAITDAQRLADRQLGDFVDGLVEGLRLRTPLEGIVVSVVQDDRVRLVRGWGRAGVDPERPADGEASLFRIGSVSKTFAYTAAMQLVAEGRIGLDDPVNGHLPDALRIPDHGWAEPIRVRHLLSHTAGFEDTALGHLFEREAAAVLAPADYLQRHRPARVRAPDTAAVYSNYGVALLGALIAQVAGMPFEDYVEQRLTGPLGMASTTFREPLPEGNPRRIDPRLAARLATGFEMAGSIASPRGFEFVSHGAAAGAASSSAADMARWMRVHLRDGELDGVRILPPGIAAGMREPLFVNATGAPPVLHGFLSERFGAVPAYGHGGATLYFMTAMALLPELDLGIFVSANSGNARGAVTDVVRAIVEHVQPLARPASLAPASDAAALTRYLGDYRGNRRAYTRAESAVMKLSGDARVDADGGGGLRLRMGSQTLRLLPEQGSVFRQDRGNLRVVFEVGSDGRATGFVVSPGIQRHERVGFWDRSGVLAGVLALAALVAATRLAGSLRRASRRRQPTRPGLAPVRLLRTFGALAWLVAVVLAVRAGLDLAGRGNSLVFDWPTGQAWWALLALSVAAATTVLELLALPAVLRSRWRASARLGHLLGLAVLALATWLLWRWNLLGMQL
ncbi:MAG: beta-lactamase family protein [Xanthomonadales bacterium]|nr:beta-lactamase family protein [Xanthomonadales bacterium]